MSYFKKGIRNMEIILQKILPLQKKLEMAALLTKNALLDGKKILICGNGGSASDSLHIATEFVCRFSKNRFAYPALALTADGSLLTAIGNDYDFNLIFVRQIQALANHGDILIVLSTSGNSENIFLALKEGKKKKCITFSFLGRGGGKSLGMADIDFLVPSNHTARVQEIHQFLLHIFCEIIEDFLI